LLHAVLLINTGKPEQAVEFLKDEEDLKTDFYALLHLGKAEFALGNFTAATTALNEAMQIFVNDEAEQKVVSKLYGERLDAQRQLTVLLNKASLELSTTKKSFGNINEGAFLPSSKPAATDEKPVPAAAQ